MLVLEFASKFDCIDHLHLECCISKTACGQHVTVCPLDPPWLSYQLTCRRLMFWHVDERRYNVDELVKTSDKMVEKAQERGVSPQDVIVLQEAKKHM